MNYAIFDSEGKCINNVEWNGDRSIWSPPDGCTAVPDAARQHSIVFSSESTGTDSLGGLTETQKQAIRDIIDGK